MIYLLKNKKEKTKIQYKNKNLVNKFKKRMIFIKINNKSKKYIKEKGLKVKVVIGFYLCLKTKIKIKSRKLN